MKGRYESTKSTSLLKYEMTKSKFTTHSNTRKEKIVCNSIIKVSDSLEKIHINGCRRLKWVTLLWEEPHPHPSLEKSTVQKDWWDSVEWKLFCIHLSFKI